MTAFSRDQETQHPLDLRLLADGSITLYCQLARLHDDVAWLKERGYQIVSLDCRAWRFAFQFYYRFAKGLRFPSYFGYNLDAVNDCLRDIDFNDKTGIVLVFMNFDKMLERQGELLPGCFRYSGKAIARTPLIRGPVYHAAAIDGSSDRD